MKVVKDIALYIVISFLVNLFSESFESNFLSQFLESNLITIQITLMAITIATYTFIIARLQDLSQNDLTKFNKTLDSMKLAIVHQLLGIGFALVLLILKASQEVISLFEKCEFVIDILLTVMFLWAIFILKDVGDLVFLVSKAKLPRNKGDSSEK